MMRISIDKELLVFTFLCMLITAFMFIFDQVERIQGIVL